LSPQIIHAKSDTSEKNTVIAQIPDAASLVAVPEVKSRIIWIVIAVILAILLGFGYYVFSRNNIAPPPAAETVVTQATVPNLIGLDEEQAKLELQKAGLILGQVNIAAPEITPQGAASGTVVMSTPNEGEEILPGSPVSIEVVGDSNEAVGLIAVPDLEGLKEAKAKTKLEDLGFVINVVRSPAQTAKADRAFLQSPAAGELAPEGSVVVVVLSTGEPTDATTVALPNVVGKPLSEAAAELQGLGLVVTLPIASDEAASGLVTGMLPAAGGEVYIGSVVILQVATAGS
jgi:beta-lactam-binding protein with PASTA domain